MHGALAYIDYDTQFHIEYTQNVLKVSSLKILSGCQYL